jgi:hypothetical protein
MGQDTTTHRQVSKPAISLEILFRSSPPIIGDERMLKTLTPLLEQIHRQAARL